MSYSLEVLNEFCQTFTATIIEPLPKLGKEARITFRCRCGGAADKSFVRLKISGMLCPKCTFVSRREKRETTNLERYGTTCTLQNSLIDSIAKETLIQKFGVNNVFKLPSIIIRRIRDTCLEKYGTEFPTQLPEVHQKTIETNLVKYGVPTTSQAECVKEKARQTNMAKYGLPHHIIPEVLEKTKKTNMRRYGVPYSFQATSVKKKIMQSIINKYGVKYASQFKGFKEKCKKTCLHKFGTRYALQSQTVRDKIYKTWLLNYGVAHPLQSPAVQAKIQKTGFKYKIYTTPKGIIRKVQGFEPYALDILFKEQQLGEDDVCTDRSCVPHIKYTYDDKNKVYFPDIYVKSQNKIIEVKSTWTYELHKQLNDAKAKATIDAGYNFEFWIFDKSL